MSNIVSKGEMVSGKRDDETYLITGAENMESITKITKSRNLYRKRIRNKMIC